ncbi:hypothetical protein PVAND_001952 [Polypedilum vanderplanki]|uniref:Ribosome biogenesis protein BOP1 homolog n=1 Tax=Polypedilum vanderplanki TaxID=319348 RepID=A0A9J6BPX1_POLVA|nr:hypothetical protein PVAND_001952 [Polypedilum vanderplanki]
MANKKLKRKIIEEKEIKVDEKPKEQSVETEEDEDYESDKDLLVEIDNEDQQENDENEEEDDSDSDDILSFESFKSDYEENENDFNSENDEEEQLEFEDSSVEDELTTEELESLKKKQEEKQKIKELVEFRKKERVEQKETSKLIMDTLRQPEDETYLAMRENSVQSKSLPGPSNLSDEIEESDKKKFVEYEDDGDTSDEEDIRNTVGNIPLHWYDEYKHIGYDWEGRKIMKPPAKDQLDVFLRKMEDPDFWRTVKDPQTGQDVVLSEEDIQLIKLIKKQRAPDQNFDAYEPWVEWFTSEVEKFPIRNIPDSKQSFLPSKVEKKKIGRLVHSLKMGWMKTKAEQEKIDAEKKIPKFYMLWDSDTGREKMRRIHDHVTAPKRALPGHAESYNPPSEYLFNEKELQDWQNLSDEPHKRKLHFIPQKYKSLRQVPYYQNYIRERFIRCLDLYLCPRAKRMKATVQPEDLIPKLPSSKDLQPFPTTQSMIYRGHNDIVRTMSIEPKGQYFVTGSDDKTIKIWEIATGRCIKTINTKGVVRSVAWCPNQKISLIAVASDKRLLLINPHVGDIKLISKKTDDILAEAPVSEEIENERIKTAVQWSAEIDKDEYKDGVRIVINHFQEIAQVTWHAKGDYFATVMPNGLSRSVLVHQLSKRRSQTSFSKSHGMVQCVLFHPIKPCLFVASQQHIRIYDLVKQEMIKKLMPSCKWISKMAIHPKGDNLLVSTYDKKVMWFDLDLSTKPYQTLKLHASAVRSVAYHSRYPLFASGSDDRGVIVCHGMVYNDLLQNALIVPLKRLEFHEKVSDYGIFEVLFHTTQPWLFSSGSDYTVRLYT